MNPAMWARGIPKVLRGQCTQWAETRWGDSWWVSESFDQDEDESDWGISDMMERHVEGDW